MLCMIKTYFTYYALYKELSYSSIRVIATSVHNREKSSIATNVKDQRPYQVLPYSYLCQTLILCLNNLLYYVSAIIVHMFTMYTCNLPIQTPSKNDL